MLGHSHAASRSRTGMIGRLSVYGPPRCWHTKAALSSRPDSTRGEPVSEPTPRVRKHPQVRNRPLAEVFGNWTRDQIQARFWAKVNKNGPVPSACPERGPCWPWTGDHQTNGYGLLRRVGAHRVAMWLADGEEPGSRHVLHHCDNPPCVRRSHLRFGTPADNAQDKKQRDRAARNFKLSPEAAQELRERYAAGAKLRDLQAHYGLSQQQVSRIVSGRTRRLPPVATPWRDRGLTTARAKITPAQRDEIRQRRNSGESSTALAREFGIGGGYINEIARGGRPERYRGKDFVPTRAPRMALPAGVVRDIRLAHAAGSVTHAELARKYGVTPSTVSLIVRNLSYRDVV